MPEKDKPSSPLKICVIGSTYPLSEDDPQVPWLRESIRRLRLRGHEVTVLAPAYEGCKSHTIDGVRVVRFRYAPAFIENLTHGSGAPNKLQKKWKQLLAIPYILFGALRGMRLQRAERFDIINAHWPFPHGFIAMPMKWMSGASLVHTCHGAELALGRKSAPIQDALAWVLSGHALLVCNSSHTRAEITRICHRKATILPYGATVEVRPEAPREHMGDEQGVIRLLTCGRQIERKGIPYLLEAMRELVKRRKIRLDITGEGNCKEQWMALSKEMGLEAHVTFHGFVDDGRFAELYRDCDLYVHPSIHDSRGDTEGLGVVLIEALSYRKPVVASAVGGIVDVIRHEETGLLVPEKEPAELVAAIERLIDDPALARRLGEQGLAHVQRYFDWDQIIDRTERLYHLASRYGCGRRLLRTRR